MQLYEAIAKTKLARLRTIQALFVAGAVGLLFAGYVVTERTIVSPLSELEEATQRMAGGDLESPVEAVSAASSEVRALAGSFESMRHKLAGSRLEAERWAAELEERVDQRTRQLAALFDVSAEISSELEIHSVLESVVEKTRSLAGGEVAVLCLLDPSGESLSVVATSGSADALVVRSQDAATKIKVSAHTIGAAILHEGGDCLLLQPQFRRSHLAVPLRIGDRILGALCVGHRDKARFGEQETRLLTLLANAGAVALENARAYEQSEQAATLAERERILVEVHDGLAQTLSFLELRLGLVQGLIEDQDLAEIPEHLALTRRTVGQASHEVRRLMSGLQASADSPRTLEERLRQTVERFAEEWKMDTELLVETKTPILGPPGVYEQMVRVVGEALTNVHKHASASHSSVTVRRHGAQAIICVQDDGPGFDLNAPSDGQHHFGLKVMETRAKWIGGELEVESALQQGTTITLRWSMAEG